tara:strand:- start:270 stop:593 length:324 start_codon:yes stop_codon:yes gene_type:complete
MKRVNKIEFLEGILETEEGVKAFKHRSFLMAQYHAKVSRISENKRSQANMADTKRLAEKYNWQLDELKDHVFTQKKRLEKREFYLKKEAEILLEKIEDHNSILKGEK